MLTWAQFDSPVGQFLVVAYCDDPASDLLTEKRANELEDRPHPERQMDEIDRSQVSTIKNIN